MENLRKLFTLLLIATVIAFVLTACSDTSDRTLVEPQGEDQSIDESPADEHPTDEHPTDEHPTGEHPTGEHPE